MSVFRTFDGWLSDQGTEGDRTFQGGDGSIPPGGVNPDHFFGQLSIPDPVVCALPAEDSGDIVSVSTDTPSVDLSAAGVDLAAEAHSNRNQWNTIQVPEYLPVQEPTADDYGNVVSAKTGIPEVHPYPGSIVEENSSVELNKDGYATEVVLWARDFHQVDTDGDGVPDSTAIGYRAEVPDNVWQERLSREEYVRDFNAINEKYGCDADVNESRPSFEVYYNPETRERENVESYNFVSDDLSKHECMDVNPHLDNPNYNDFSTDHSPSSNTIDPVPSYDPPSVSTDSGSGASSE